MPRSLSILLIAFLVAGCAIRQEPMGGTQGTIALENTYWKLTRLGDRSIAIGPGQREPHLVLRGQDRRVSGFTGCNQMAGGYTLDGQTLSFTRMISTKMACVGGGMETETAFTAALQKVRAWSIAGQTLTLSDGAGQPLITLESRGPAPNTL